MTALRFRAPTIQELTDEDVFRLLETTTPRRP